MQTRQSRHRAPLRALIGILVIASIAAAAWLLLGQPGDAGVRSAGSTDVVAPIAPLRLVSVMELERSSKDARFAGANNLSRTDAEIEVGVAEKLEEMNLPAESVDIDVKDREARLQGRVADALLRDAIEITVRSVPGVRTVDNRLEILNAAKNDTP